MEKEPEKIDNKIYIFAVGIKKMEEENNKFKNTGNVGT